MVWDRADVRQFAAVDVPDEDVQTILTLASKAPSGFNLQPWRFVEVRQRLQEAAHDQQCILPGDLPKVLQFARGWWARSHEVREIFENLWPVPVPEESDAVIAYCNYSRLVPWQ